MTVGLLRSITWMEKTHCHVCCRIWVRAPRSAALRMAQVVALRPFLGFDVLMAKKLIAEFIGTFTLVFLAVGAAVAGIGVARDATANADFIVPASGTLGIAIAFGFVLMFLV